MHICVLDDRLASHVTWCPTLGECDRQARATPTSPAGVCRGLVCEHGCQRSSAHVGPARHAASLLASSVREDTAMPYIGRHRADPDVELAAEFDRVWDLGGDNA